MSNFFEHSELPAPILFEPLELTDHSNMLVSIRFSSIENALDIVTHINPKGIRQLDDSDAGYLLIDVWSKSEPEKLIANITFLVEDNLFAVRDIHVDQEWRNKGLLCIMIAIVQNISGWSRNISGLEWTNVW